MKAQILHQEVDLLKCLKNLIHKAKSLQFYLGERNQRDIIKIINLASDLDLFVSKPLFNLALYILNLTVEFSLRFRPGIDESSSFPLRRTP